MGVGSGLGGSLGVAAESVYGTYAAPARFLEPQTKLELKKMKNTVQGGGLAAGRLVQPGSRRVVTTEAGAGSFDVEVTNKSMGVLLQAIFGGAGTIVQQGATAAWLQTHALADNVGRMLSLQAGIPDTTGTVRPYTGKGAKITKGEFSCGVNENLILAVDADLRQVSEAETLAAPSYPTGLMPFNFAQMAVKLGTVGAESTVNGVKKATVSVERGLATERFYAGAGGLKAEPLTNDYIKVSGSLDVDFVSKADFADRFASDAPTSMVIEWVGPLIASSFFSTLRLKLPMTFFDGDTPVLGGPDVVSGAVPFTTQFDLTNPAISCEYVSTDTAI